MPTRLPTPTPRHHTAPTPGRKTRGRAVATVARALGRPLMPWQRRAVDVALEVDADTGRYAYPLVLVTVPRQSGKTALAVSAMLERSLTTHGGRIWYTAQTGLKAREQSHEMFELCERSPFAPHIKVYRGAGDTRLDIPASGGRIKSHPPTSDSLHGNQSDMNVIDEGWFFTEPDAHALMGAITPTQLTRPNPQTWIVSTQGTLDRSVWFHGLVDAARAGELPGACLIDYGLAADDDPEDLAALAAAHPALGHTVTMDALRDARASVSSSEWARAYGNIRAGAIAPFIDPDTYRATITPAPIPDGAPVTFAAAVDVDRTQTAIAAAALDADGTPAAEIVAVLPGTADAGATLADLAARWSGNRALIDRYGPAATVADDAERAGAEVDTLTVRDVTTAAADLYDRLLTNAVRLAPSDALDAAVAVATRRRVGDAWAWSRRSSSTSVAALEAVTLAVYGAIRRPAPAARPRIYTGG